VISAQEFYRWERHSRETIDFKMVYVDIAGDLLAGLLLSQIVYWFTPDRHGQHKTRVVRDGRRWLAKPDGEWHGEIRLTPDQARRARGILKEKGLIVVECFKFDGAPTTHISLNENAILAAIYQLDNQAQEQAGPNPSGPEPKSIRDGAHFHLGHSPNPSGPEPKSLTETTTEITTETTTEREGECAQGARAPTPKSKMLDESFDVFWQAWPQKVARLNAQKAWRKLKPSADLQATILKDIAARASQDKNWLEGFIPHAATYLNQRRWEDEILTSKPPSVPGNIGPRRPVETGEKRVRPGERDESGLAYLAEEMRRRGLQTPYDAMFGEAGHG
jgi:hypothetical protein